MESTQQAALASRIFRFIFFMTNIFGIGNYLTDDYFVVTSSIILRVYGVLVFVTVAGYFFNSLSRVTLLYSGSNTMSLLYFEYVVYWLASLSCFGVSIYNQSKLREWLRSTRGIILGFGEETLRKLFRLCVVTMVSCFLAVIVFTVISYYGHVQGNLSPFSLFMSAVMHGTTLVTVVQFVMAVLFISRLFKEINDELAHSFRQRTDIDSPNLFIIEFAHYLTKAETNSPAITTIRTLSKKHDFYCKLTKDLNECFSPQLFLFAGLCFIELTYSVFCFAVNDEGTRFSVVFLANWFITYTMLLVGFTVSSQILINEAKKSGPLTHKIINCERTRLVRRALEMFSLQIHQTELQITAMGLFSVNNSLLYEMTGGITSAIVILIQFQKYSTSDGSTPGVNNNSTL